VETPGRPFHSPRLPHPAFHRPARPDLRPAGADLPFSGRNVRHFSTGLDGFSMLNIQAEGSWGRPVFSKKRSGFVPVFTAKGQTCQPDQNPPAFPLTGSSFQLFRSSRKHFTGKKEKYPSSAAAAKKMFTNAAAGILCPWNFDFQ